MPSSWPEIQMPAMDAHRPQQHAPVELVPVQALQVGHQPKHYTTVDGSEIRRSPVEVGSISYIPFFLQGFIHPRSDIPGGAGFQPSTVLTGNPSDLPYIYIV